VPCNTSDEHHDLIGNSDLYCCIPARDCRRAGGKIDSRYLVGIWGMPSRPVPDCTIYPARYASEDLGPIAALLMRQLTHGSWAIGGLYDLITLIANRSLTQGPSSVSIACRFLDSLNIFGPGACIARGSLYYHHPPTVLRHGTGHF
jgi:hypothetical protein